jgi:hypothetical protein
MIDWRITTRIQIVFRRIGAREIAVLTVRMRSDKDTGHQRLIAADDGKKEEGRKEEKKNGRTE